MLYYINKGKKMKKMDVIKLIRYHVDNNDQAFRDQAYSIAEDFCKMGDNQVGTYIISLLSGYNTMAPQEREIDSDFLRRSEIINNPLPLPQKIYEDIIGITNAVSFNSGINKFLFASIYLSIGVTSTFSLCLCLLS